MGTLVEWVFMLEVFPFLYTCSFLSQFVLVGLIFFCVVHIHILKIIYQLPSIFQLIRLEVIDHKFES